MRVHKHMRAALWVCVQVLCGYMRAALWVCVRVCKHMRAASCEHMCAVGVRVHATYGVAMYAGNASCVVGMCAGVRVHAS